MNKHDARCLVNLFILRLNCQNAYYLFISLSNILYLRIIIVTGKTGSFERLPRGHGSIYFQFDIVAFNYRKKTKIVLLYKHNLIYI